MKPEKKARASRSRRIETLQIYSLLIPVLILIFIFSYIPLYGIVIAFQDYMPGSPFLGEGVKWVGLKHFINFVQGEYFGRLIRNTLVLSGLNLLFGFTAPILFALLMDQIGALRFKKLVQTASYMPYFISTVVVAGMVISFIDTQGIVTNFLTLFGLERQNYRINPDAFSAIDPGLYESAKLDGANRLQQVLHITLPGIKHVIAINLIMAIGGILNTNSELILLLYSEATYNVADVIGTYTYRLGIVGGQYSYTTAAGLFMSVIGFALTCAANRASNRLTGMGLW